MDVLIEYVLWPLLIIGCSAGACVLFAWLVSRWAPNT